MTKYLKTKDNNIKNKKKKTTKQNNNIFHRQVKCPPELTELVIYYISSMTDSGGQTNVILAQIKDRLEILLLPNLNFLQQY